MLHKLKQSPSHRVTGTPVYATKRGGRLQPLPPAKQCALDAFWPSCEARMRLGGSISADYLAEHCFVSRCHATQYLKDKGCFRSGVKFKLARQPNDYNPNK